MNNIKKLRESRNLTQVELSKLTNINLDTLKSYEQNLRDIKSAKTIFSIKLAEVLKCNIEDLFDD